MAPLDYSTVPVAVETAARPPRSKKRLALGLVCATVFVASVYLITSPGHSSMVIDEAQTQSALNIDEVADLARSCTSTAGWNLWGFFTCSHVEAHGWCSYKGSFFNYPEQNCCACGGGTRYDTFGTHHTLSCPVMRALVGSGVLHVQDTYPNIMAAIFLMLGYPGPQGPGDGTCDANWQGCSWPIKIFEGAMLSSNPGGPNDQRVPKNMAGLVDLNKMNEFFDHGASSGIIGSATSGDHDDHVFNQDKYDQLMAFAGQDGDPSSFTHAEWGAAVNFFAAEGLAKHQAAEAAGNDRADDVNWSDTAPGRFSWGILAVEYANTFAVFKDNNDKMTTASVASLFNDGVLPAGWTGARRTITPELLLQTGALMNIQIPAEQAYTMVSDAHTKAGTGPAGPVGLVCGPNYSQCSNAIRDCQAGTECPGDAPYRYPGNHRCFPSVWGGEACNIDPETDPLSFQQNDNKCTCVQGFTMSSCHGTNGACEIYKNE